jgi:hypothetical protein
MGRWSGRLLLVIATALLLPACGGGKSNPPPSQVTAPPEGASVEISQPPFVRIISPGPRSQVPEGSTITLQAEATDPDTDILRVDFFDGTKPIGGQWTPPFIVAWGGLTRGTHLVTAVAIDVEGVSTISDPITVVVTGPRGEEEDERDNEGHPVEQPRRR